MTTQQPTQPADVRTLAEQFIQHGIYLRDWSQRTASTYTFSFRELPSQLTKASLNAAVVAMRERGLSAGGINLRIRSINSLLTWLHEEGHVSERLRIKLLKNPPKPIQTINAQDIRLLMAFRPSGRIQIRTWTLAVLLLDCGLRIDEALGLERANVDLDGLVLRVLGKGSRERRPSLPPGLPQTSRARQPGRYTRAERRLTRRTDTLSLEPCRFPCAL